MKGILVDLTNKNDKIITFNSLPHDTEPFRFSDIFEDEKIIDEVFYVNYQTDDEIKFLADFAKNIEYKIILFK